ncbi:hypothetical protein [Pseudovibrio denitrificans]|nr:hypothetical protein [Pseudovibrio denitrificans]
MINTLECPQEEVLRMGLSNPAALMGLTQSVANLETADVEDLLLIAPDYSSFTFLSQMA